LKLEIVNKERAADSLSGEERVSRIVAMLSSWLMKKASEKGIDVPTKEEKAMWIADLIESK